MTSRELYQQKLSTADAAMSLIHSGDTSVSGTYACEPLTLLRTLPTIAPRVRDVKVWCAITKENDPFFSDPAYRNSFFINSFFTIPRHGPTTSAAASAMCHSTCTR